jgi:hypothetical protein
VDGRPCATNLGEKKANVKRKAELNIQSKNGKPQILANDFDVSMWHSRPKSLRLQGQV